jgi:uncharacterized RDD family membrane protein YckC
MLVDPTEVVGRRMAGWLVDVAVITGTVLIVLLLLGDSFERPGSDTGLDLRRFGSDTAIFFRSTVAVVHAWELLAAAGAGAFATFLLLVVLPARRGWTPGLLAAELRLVDREGGPVGLRSASVRFVGWVIDILPGVPLVGLLAMRFGRHHQRVGDRLAHTYVVDRAFAGRPPHEPAPVDADGHVTTVLIDHAPPQDEGTADGALTDQSTVRRGFTGLQDRDGPPAESSDAPTPSPSPAGEGGPEATVWAPDEGQADPDDRDDPDNRSGPDDKSHPGDRHDPEDQSHDGERAPGRAPDGVVADQPLWDRDRNQYVMWHGPTGRWVGYDDSEQSWKPL